jgi:cell division protein FtsW (lipid II flippase)
VNLRLLPATGIPLPFISQGGSSLLMMCVAAGLLQSIASRRPASSREQWSAERWL